MNQRIVMVVLLSLYSLTGMTAKLESMHVRAEHEKTSVTIVLQGVTNPRVFTLPNPDRVVIDFLQTTTTLNLKQVAVGNGLIEHVRLGHPTPSVLRLVLDTKQAAHVNKHMQGNALHLELLPTHLTQRRVEDKKTAIKSIHVRHAPPKTMRDVIIVLDPGHGGKDPGAIGPRRNVEKNVVLAIALKLKQQIDKQPGMRAVLTRDGDYYVGLRQRLAIARRHKADIFVSIHADAFINQHSNGASVFALSQTGATSEAARWLAEKENYSELGGVNLSGLDDQNGVIRTVLIDLSQTATIGASLQMGTAVLGNLDKITSLHNDAVEQARFVVLKSPDIPSILIETGFISNPLEEKNLTNPYYQTRLTNAIFAGVKRYFWEHPPQGTRIEAMSNVNARIVRANTANASVHVATKHDAKKGPWA